MRDNGVHAGAGCYCTKPFQLTFHQQFALSFEPRKKNALNKMKCLLVSWETHSKTKGKVHVWNDSEKWLNCCDQQEGRNVCCPNWVKQRTRGAVSAGCRYAARLKEVQKREQRKKCHLSVADMLSSAFSSFPASLVRCFCGRKFTPHG